MLSGTALIMSSESDMTKGMIIMPITKPAANALSEATVKPHALAQIAYKWRHRQCRKKTVDNGGNTGKDFEHRLGD